VLPCRYGKLIRLFFCETETALRFFCHDTLTNVDVFVCPQSCGEEGDRADLTNSLYSPRQREFAVEGLEKIYFIQIRRSPLISGAFHTSCRTFIFSSCIQPLPLVPATTILPLSTASNCVTLGFICPVRCSPRSVKTCKHI